MRLLIGTYTDIALAPSTSKGVYLYDLDSTTLQATCLDCVQVKNPSWVAASHGNAFTLSECGDQSWLHSIAIDGDTLRLTSSKKSPGDDPCHCVALNGMLYSANYSSGSITAVKVNDDGTLGETIQNLHFHEHSTSPRQLTAHLHNMAVSPCGDLMAASNLGGDCIYLMRINGDGTIATLHTLHTTAGSGPRHLTWNNDGTRLYLITELTNEVMAFALDGNRLVHMQTLTAEAEKGHGAAHIHIHPSGKWLYASVRVVNNGIAMFGINGDGTLERKKFYPTGTHPRHFAITPCGSLLLNACRDKNAIELYRINSDGTLAYLAGHDIGLGMPVCITLL